MKLINIGFGSMVAAGRVLSMLAPDSAPIKRLVAIAKEEGLRFVYVGNVLDEERSSTYCPDCGRLLVRRRGYRVEALWEAPGVCPGCGQRIPGVWTW